MQAQDQLVLSPYYPHSKFVNAGVIKKLEFIRSMRWHKTIEEFYEDISSPEFAPNIELRPEVLDKWRRHTEFRPFIRFEMRKLGTDIEPMVLAGFYCGDCKHKDEKRIELVLYYPGFNSYIHE